MPISWPQPTISSRDRYRRSCPPVRRRVKREIRRPVTALRLPVRHLDRRLDHVVAVVPGADDARIVRAGVDLSHRDNGGRLLGRPSRATRSVGRKEACVLTCKDLSHYLTNPLPSVTIGDMENTTNPGRRTCPVCEREMARQGRPLCPPLQAKHHRPTQSVPRRRTTGDECVAEIRQARKGSATSLKMVFTTGAATRSPHTAARLDLDQAIRDARAVAPVTGRRRGRGHISRARPSARVP